MFLHDLLDSVIPLHQSREREEKEVLSCCRQNIKNNMKQKKLSDVNKAFSEGILKLKRKILLLPYIRASKNMHINYATIPSKNV